MAADFFTYGAAKQAIDVMWRNGLVNEAVYFARKTLSAGSQQGLIDRLSKTAAGGLAPYLEYIAKNWESFRDEDVSTRFATREAWVRLASHVPDIIEDNRYAPFFVPTLSTLVHGSVVAEALLGLSEDLVRKGEGEKAAAALVTAARPEFADASVLEAAGKLALNLPERKPPPSDELAKRLGQISTSMALLNKYGLAFQTELIAKGSHTDVGQYRDIGYRMIELAHAGRSSPVNLNRQGDEIELGSKLWQRGYWADAAEMLELAVGVPTSKDEIWKNMWALLGPDTSVVGKMGAGVSLARQGAATAGSAIGSALGSAIEYLPSLGSTFTFPKGSPAGGSSPADKVAPSWSDAFEKTSPAETAERTSPAEATRDAEIEDKLARRRVNIDVRRARDLPRHFRVMANIGAPKAGTAGGPFREPDWHGRDHVDLRLTLNGYAEITPAWHDLRLGKTGDTPFVEFRIVAFDDHPLRLELRVYSAREFMLLERYALDIEVTAGSPA